MNDLLREARDFVAVCLRARKSTIGSYEVHTPQLEADSTAALLARLDAALAQRVPQEPVAVVALDVYEHEDGVKGLHCVPLTAANDLPVGNHRLYASPHPPAQILTGQGGRSPGAPATQCPTTVAESKDRSRP